MPDTANKYLDYIHTLTQIGIALSAEKDYSRLLEMILSSAMELCNADAGTIYLLHKKTTLNFSIVANKTLQIKSSNLIAIDFPVLSIPLFIDGLPNLENVASYCVHQNKTINIEDAYQVKGFDFSGMQNADKKIGYHSVSFLTIPLVNHENTIIGVLQLINAIDETTGKIIPFSIEKVSLAESFASQAAITLTKHELLEAQKKLFESLIQLIAKAIDEKSAFTSNHCDRVPLITMMIANAANNAAEGSLKDFHLTKDQLEELTIAAWLHDCGKITTPEYVVNKSTKLETICDRVEVIDLRIEIIKRDLKIAFLEKQLKSSPMMIKHNNDTLQKSLEELTRAQEFLHNVNKGGEVLSSEDQNHIKYLAEQFSYETNSHCQHLLSAEEVKNLCVSRGTLNDDERNIINNHVAVTKKMLSSLPYPDYLKHVPDIAGSHHERLDGKGYPSGIGKDQLSMQARILAIADIFEALTAADRPYKKAKTLKESLSIMQEMRNNGHIDPDLYDLFIQEKVYLDYAKKYLRQEQVDV